MGAQGNISRRSFIGTALVAFVSVAVDSIIEKEEAMPDYTFYDDFDGPAGSAPDPTKWGYDLGGGGWGNSELETYTNSRANSYVDGNSNLVIAATEVNGAYFSARLRTIGLFNQIGGHFEGRVKLSPQLGIWPAFWLLGQDVPTVQWPKCGEIDILENFGYSSEISSSVYTQNVGNSTYGYGASIPSDGDWHVHRADVEAEGITFSIDGYEYGHCPATYCPPASWVFGPQEPNNGGLFFLLNIAVGGKSSQNPPPATTKFPATMLVDYVRAWQ
jgi:beta-glucanase (GH16 family)